MIETLERYFNKIKNIQAAQKTFKILIRSLPNSRNESHIRSLFFSSLLSFHLNLFPFPLLLLLRRNLFFDYLTKYKNFTKSHRVRHALAFFLLLIISRFAVLLLLLLLRPHMKGQVKNYHKNLYTFFIHIYATIIITTVINIAQYSRKFSLSHAFLMIILLHYDGW